MDALERFRYGIMRCLPGRRGKKYARKHAFAQALRGSRGMTSIDLGANVGKYTRIMASEAKQVIAFEPDPWTCTVLRHNLADLDNIRIEPVAASTSERKVPLYRDPGFAENPVYHSRSSSVVARGGLIIADGAMEIQQIDFIRYLEELNEDIGILKIDIEGAEVELLESLFNKPAVLKRIAYIFAETHERAYANHRPRVAALREMAQLTERPKINLDWQ